MSTETSIKKPKNFNTQYIPISNPPTTIDEFCENVTIQLDEIRRILKQCKGILAEIRNQQKVDK